MLSQSTRGQGQVKSRPGERFGYDVEISGDEWYRRFGPVSRPFEVRAKSFAKFGADELTYGERATALCASDMPSRRSDAGDVSVEDIKAWVVQGVKRLGLATTFSRTEQARQAAGRSDWDLYRDIYPKPRRLSLALGLSNQLSSTCGGAA